MNPNWNIQRFVTDWSANHMPEIFSRFEDSGPISNFDLFFEKNDEIDYPGFDVSATEYCKYFTVSLPASESYYMTHLLKVEQRLIFTITRKRGIIFQNLVLPILMLGWISVLATIIPSDSGEKFT